MTVPTVLSPSRYHLRPAYGYAGRVNLPTGQDSPNSIVSDAAGNVYTASGATSGVLSKIRTSDMSIQATVALAAPARALAYDAGRGHILAVTTESPARVYNIRASDLVILGSLVLNGGEDSVYRCIYDGAFLLVACAKSPGIIVSVNVSANTPVRGNAVGLSSGENLPKSMDYDGNGNFYVGTSGGIVVKMLDAAGVISRVGNIQLGVGVQSYISGNVVVAFDRVGGKYLYAGAGGDGGFLNAVFQINPATSPMSVVNIAGGRFSTGLQWTDLFVDRVSAFPGRYLYGGLYDSTNQVGWLVQFDTSGGLAGFALREARTFSLNFPDLSPLGLAWDGTYLYVALSNVPGSILQFDVSFLGLTLYLTPTIEYTRPVIGERWNVIGLQNPIARIYGVQGRQGSLTHIISPKSTPTLMDVQIAEDEQTVANCVPIAFLGMGSNWGRAVSLIGAPKISRPYGDLISWALLTLDYVESAI